MASPRRLEKLNMLLKEELARIINREIDFLSDTMMTVTRVETASDMHYADAFISVFGDDAKSAVDILKKNVYDIQRILNRSLRMRPVPKIRFLVDEGEERRESIEKTLAELKKESW